MLVRKRKFLPYRPLMRAIAHELLYTYARDYHVRSRPQTVWESVEAHQKLINDKVVYPQLKRAASSMFDVARIAMFHVLPTSDPAGALSAPVTELATFTARTARSKPVIEVLVDDLARAIGSAPSSAGAFSPCWGPLAEPEKENVLVLFIGWTSVEVRASYVIRPPYAALMSTCPMLGALGLCEER